MNTRLGVMMCVLLTLAAGAEQTKSIEPKELATVLRAGGRAKIVLRSGAQISGTVETVFPEAVAIKTERPPAVQSISYAEIRTLKYRDWDGNKRTWLPVILSGTLGTLSFVAAGATEELKPSYLPLAAGFTAALAVGGYYGGRALDRREVTYAVRQQSNPQ